MLLNFTLNNEPVSLETQGDRRVVDLLREDFGLTGTKTSCGNGDCGSCAILVDGVVNLSCLMFAAQIQDRNVITIEGISDCEALHHVQQAFVEAGGVQCGFCTPGMILVSINLLETNPNPTREEIRQALSGNLCRCTGYKMIVDAVQLAATRLRNE
jgi:carbon-monoxide dehydrogenase small subunit